MLDISLFRKNPEVVKDSLTKRGMEPLVVDEVVKLDLEWREKLKHVEELKHKRNVVSEQINLEKKAGRDAADKIAEMKEVAAQIGRLDSEINRLKEKRDELLMNIPNLVDKSVPVGKDETENKQIKKWGKITKPKFPLIGHEELATKLDLLDVKKAGEVAGARFYYLKGDLARLNYALISFTLDFLRKKGFVVLQPPYMLNRKALEGAITLATFEDTIYKIEGEDLYLIGTAEHAINAYHMNDIISFEKLPIRYAGISPCFRKEAGAHGKDTKGIFRVHQFEKVEQFVFCRPEDGKKEFDILLKNLEEIYQKLKIPYRLVVLCTGDLGRVATKTIDLEAWMPIQNTYRELASCSNCLDYQARRANIKYRDKDGEAKFVYTLNNTAVAMQRTLVAIMENFQNKDGSITIPNVLRHYMGGQKYIGAVQREEKRKKLEKRKK